MRILTEFFASSFLHKYQYKFHFDPQWKHCKKSLTLSGAAANFT